MTSPNINATPETNADKLDGIDESGAELGFRKVAMLYVARLFGLPKDYAFPEGGNETASALNHVATLAKVLTRQALLADGNTYDVFDMLATNTKWILSQNIHINDDELDSVNYKPPVAAAPKSNKVARFFGLTK
jgi:hypothetical protein